MKLNSKSINYNVQTVDELVSLDGLEGDTVVVTDENRGGVFVYREDNVGTNNGGTIFNGWTRQYDGAVNVKWFGAVGDGITSDTSNIQAAIDSLGSVGGTVYFPKGDYPCALVITTPNIKLEGEQGVILRGVSSGSIVDVQAGGTGFILEGFNLTGQTTAQESITGDNNTQAMHCIRIYATDFKLKNFTTKGARQDGLYIRIDGWANGVIEDFYLGSTCRNPCSIIRGRGFVFRNGTMFLDNSYYSTYGNGLYLFDQEPNDTDYYFDTCLFENVIFKNGGLIADNWGVIFHTTNIGTTNKLFVTFKKCRFESAGGAAAAQIRLDHDDNPIFENMVIEDCWFESRAFSIAGDGAHTLINSKISSVEVGKTNFTYGTSIGDGCHLSNVSSSTGTLSISGATSNEVTLLNVMSYDNQLPKDTEIVGALTASDDFYFNRATTRNYISSRSLNYAGTSAFLDVCQLGTRGSYKITVGSTEASNAHLGVYAEKIITISGDYTYMTATEYFLNGTHGATVQMKVDSSGYNADSRILQIKPKQATGSTFSIKVEVLGYKDYSNATVTWLI